LKNCTRKGVNGLKNHIKQIPIGTSTSNMIHDTPLITKNPRPSKGHAPSFNQQFLDFPPFVAVDFSEDTLLEGKAEANTRGRFGYTALMVAVPWFSQMPRWFWPKMMGET